MATIQILSNQLTPPSASQQSQQIRNYPIDNYGKHRVLCFEIPAAAITAVGDIGSTFDLVKIPYGRVRILPASSRIWCSAWGAGRTLGFGLRSYITQPGQTVIAEDATALAAAVDVSGALNAATLNAALWKFDVFSIRGNSGAGPTLPYQGGVGVFATLGGGTVPIGALLRGQINIVVE
jgi:hypothetical protein